MGSQFRCCSEGWRARAQNRRRGRPGTMRTSVHGGPHGHWAEGGTPERGRTAEGNWVPQAQASRPDADPDAVPWPGGDQGGSVLAQTFLVHVTAELSPVRTVRGHKEPMSGISL